MVVEAAAGTGKTTCLIGRILALLAEGKCSAREIAAVTFTHKAAAEMRMRLQLALEENVSTEPADDRTRARRELLQTALDDISHLFVGTIHSFCGRLLQERPVEAHVEFAFGELEKKVDRLIATQAWRETIERLRAEDDDAAAKLNSLGVQLNDLKGSFLKFANYPDVTDWADAEAPPPDAASFQKACEDYAAHIGGLRTAFPRRAERGDDELMNEMESFCDVLGVTDWQDMRDVLTLLDVKAKPIVRQYRWPGEMAKKQNPLAKREQVCWEEFYNQTIEPFRAQLCKYRYYYIIQLYRTAAAELANKRQDLGLLNFQDLLMKAAALLRDYRGVRKYFSNKYKYLLVDEFQDTDPIQAEMLMLLAAEDNGEADWRRCRPRPGALFVVGDPKQSIYRFRRADIVTYNEVKGIILGNGGELVQLTANFRAVKPLVDWTNNHFAGEFPSEADDYAPAYVPLQLGRTNSGESDLSGIYVIPLPKEDAGNQDRAAACDAEVIATYVANALAKRRAVPSPAKIEGDPKAAGAQAGDFMVLTRKKKRLSLYAGELQKRRIPHAVTGSNALNVLDELSILRSTLAAAIYPENPIRLVAFLRGVGWGASDRELYAFKQAGGRFSFKDHGPKPEGDTAIVAEAYIRLRRFERWIENLPAVAAVERILDDLGLVAFAAATVGGDGHAGALLKAVEILRLRQREQWSASALAEDLDDLVATEDKELWEDAIPAKASAEESTVRVMNLHQAKGLEAPVVFLADPAGGRSPKPDIHIDRRGGKARGYLYIYTIKGQKQIDIAYPSDWEEAAEEARKFAEAEEARLRYVAATRAGAMLTVTLRGKDSSPWYPLEKDLTDASPLPAVDEIESPAEEQAAILTSVVTTNQKMILARRGVSAKPSYGSVGEKSRALAKVTVTTGAHDGDAAWGRVIHALLETAVTSPQTPLESLAHLFLRQERSDVTRADEAVTAVKAAAANPIWGRALAARRRLAEVPYWRRVLENGGESILVSGVIDLAFEEEDGWVLLDYKTSTPGEDVVAFYTPQVSAYARAWKEMTGAKVKEAGFLFVGGPDGGIEYVTINVRRN